MKALEKCIIGGLLCLIAGIPIALVAWGFSYSMTGTPTFLHNEGVIGSAIAAWVVSAGLLGVAVAVITDA